MHSSVTFRLFLARTLASAFPIPPFGVAWDTTFTGKRLDAFLVTQTDSEVVNNIRKCYRITIKSRLCSREENGGLAKIVGTEMYVCPAMLITSCKHDKNQSLAPDIISLGFDQLTRVKF